MSAVARVADVYRKNDHDSSWLRAAQSSGYKTGPQANSCRPAALCHEISNRKNSLHIDMNKSFDAIRMTTLLEFVVFLAPPLRPDADLPCASRPVKPRAQLNPCNNSHPSTRRLETDLGRARQHIVHLQCLRGLFCKLVHIDAGLCGCNCWRTPPELQR